MDPLRRDGLGVIVSLVGSAPGRGDMFSFGFFLQFVRYEDTAGLTVLIYMYHGIGGSRGRWGSVATSMQEPVTILSATVIIPI